MLVLVNDEETAEFIAQGPGDDGHVAEIANKGNNHFEDAPVVSRAA